MDEKNLHNKMTDKDLIDDLRKMADDIPVPPALEPDTVERMLEDRAKKKRRKSVRIYGGAAAAACACVVIGLSAAYLTGHPGDGAASTMSGGVGSAMSGGAESADGGGAENADAGSSESTAAGGAEPAAEQADELAAAEDYNEIYRYIQAQRDAEEKLAASYSDGGSAGAVEDSAASQESSSAAATGTSGKSGNYSDTNVRTEGVGEADIVKTDGDNIYLVNGETIEIVDITSDEMEHLAQIEMDEDCYVTELYAVDERLLILYTREAYDDGKTGYDGTYRQYTCTDVYDISDPADPEKISTLSQSGYYNTMRVKDGYVYVLSDYSLPYDISRPEPRTYIPEIQGEIMPVSDIYMPQRKMGNDYTVITAFSLDDPKEKTDSKAVFGTANECYVSTENIYLTESYYNNNDANVTQTSIRRIAYENGVLTGTAQTKVDGILNDSFSIDEYEGYLRMVTTVTSVNETEGGFLTALADVFRREETETEVRNVDTNSLYILDEDLNVTGEIRDLAPDERVYSARLMGDTGYFVTFRETDPLFSVDLSDPHNPKIIGELKIPGFSEYLHPYGDGKLLGIGMDVDEESVATEGVKLSMFDISDPSDVKEENKYIMEEMYGTDAGYDYKAVFADVEKNLFGFLAYGDSTVYTVFTYDEEGGFREVFSRTLNWAGSVRGMYAGDTFYLISANTIESFRLADFKKVDDIVL